MKHETTTAKRVRIYTPGPWQAKPFEARQGNVTEWTINAKHWEGLASVNGQEDPFDAEFLDGEANAKLIAAAPALFESIDVQTLQWFYGRLAHVHKENEGYDYMIKLKGIIDRQLAAVAAASVDEY
jgi:hypothetical protein